MAALCHAICVVQFRRTIETETHAETLQGKEAAPFLVQEDTVGLDPVPHAPGAGPVLALEFDSLAEEVHAESGRLSTVPRKVDLRPGRGFHVLDDVLLQERLCHAKRTGAGIEAALVLVITILAVEVTAGPGWLGKDLELP